jgi:hypothetical protein
MYEKMLWDYIKRIMGRVLCFNPVNTVKILRFRNRQIIEDYYSTGLL